ncbi:IucA/IucC family siderophore biosynthesis protein [Hazenella sp. IB182357]|uniref:IucA/IucC family siderophore biosynthesis protein n=1 Tax=Polycladospora coralii TaxID=2771432 RepID=A0A926RST8_9BACL|nr:IucA/IucC family siderophore biosynthesis protein [Polycladospora coralii]MBD1371880.1 IucA/IucC family siderophore biosynthesis protein [Polycladospora coralii]
MQAVQNIIQTLNPTTWKIVSRNLLTKMIAELMYEDMLHPEVMDEREDRVTYQLKLKNDITYTYQAKRRLFNSFTVYEETIQRHIGEKKEEATNPIQFLLDIQTTVGMNSTTAGHLIREYNQTLIADATIYEKKKEKAGVDLTKLDYAELEGEMEGHPWITYNKGRIGFSYEDYLAYAPEQQKSVQIAWLAVHRTRTDFHAVSELNHDDLIRSELGEQQYEAFLNQLQSANLNPHDYFFLPVHEWQWNNYIIPFFAEELAQQFIVPLGDGHDHYLPQQSVRTFVNITNKEKHHVKLPMSILNTLVYRGLPGERTVLAPQITEYIKGIWEKDSFLNQTCRLILPGEIASLNYDHPYYTHMEGAPYQYLEMLGCIWRESIYTYLDEGEHPITLASLLYVDGSGTPFVSRLIEQSGLSADQWMDRLFEVVLPPLLHYLYQYGVVFSPHGQNTILVLKEGVPHRLAMKDFVDDVNVSDQPLPELANIPATLKEVLRSEPPEGLCQFIFTGLFVCHMRYLSHIMDDHHDISEAVFWEKAQRVILAYQAQFPALSERFACFDLLRPEFTKLCLNRNRMLDYGYEDDDDRPHASEYGKVKNPLAGSKIHTF